MLQPPSAKTTREIINPSRELYDVENIEQMIILLTSYLKLYKINYESDEKTRDMIRCTEIDMNINIDYYIYKSVYNYYLNNKNCNKEFINKFKNYYKNKSYYKIKLL